MSRLGPCGGSGQRSIPKERRSTSAPSTATAPLWETQVSGVTATRCSSTATGPLRVPWTMGRRPLSTYPALVDAAADQLDELGQVVVAQDPESDPAAGDPQRERGEDLVEGDHAQPPAESPSSAVLFSRISTLRILPVTVIGKSSTSIT